MSRLIVSDAAGNVLRECQLDRERIRIGRKPDNDIQLDDLLVSNEHALVTTIRNDSFIQDLNSMNGVRVNGRLIKHHHLQPGDEISIAGFALKYVHEPWVMPESTWLPPQAEATRQATIRAIAPDAGESLFNLDVGSDLGLTRDIADTEIQGHVPLDHPTTILAAPPPAGVGFIRLVAGPGAGRETQLARPVTTLGKPGIQTAVISRRSSGYFLTYVEGTSYPQVNGVEVGATPQPLNDHDIIEIAGTRLEFFYR
jgi:pSer/pThr/pTyr-binding forkhead associated (FHA) protein